GSRPHTLLDFFPDDFLVMIDESHVTIPQIGGMYEGDRSRKTVLVEHGFRLPSALDNRPLRFDEFMQMTKRRSHVSATPGAFEIGNSRPENQRPSPVKGRGDDRGFAHMDLKKLHVVPSGSSEPVDAFDPTQPVRPLVVAQI